MDDFEDFDDSPKKQSSLVPIVEVPTPSETGSVLTARSDTKDTGRYSNESDGFENESSEEEDQAVTSRSTARSRRKGNYHDMMPPDEMLATATKRAAQYRKKQKINKAIQEYIRCTAFARIVYGDGHWKLAKAYADLADAYFSLKNYFAQAVYHCENARAIMMSGVQLSSGTDKSNILETLMQVYYIHGKASTQLKKYVDAETSLQKAEKLHKEYSKQPAVSDEELENWEIDIATALAKLYARQSKTAIARTYFDKVLDLMETKHGRDSVKLIPVYQALGRLEQAQGRHSDHEKAIEHYLQAHSIASAKYKSGSVEVADTALALGCAYSNVGEENAEISAESYFNEALVAYQTAYGNEHKKTIDTQDELARLMIRIDRYDEAVELMRSTLPAKREVYGEFSDEVAATLKLIGSVHLSKGETEKALRSLKKCHALETTAHGANSKRAKDTQRTLDVLMSNPSLAAKHKKDALKDRPRFANMIGTAQLGSTKT